VVVASSTEVFIEREDDLLNW